MKKISFQSLQEKCNIRFSFKSIREIYFCRAKLSYKSLYFIIFRFNYQQITMVNLLRKESKELEVNFLLYIKLLTNVCLHKLYKAIGGGEITFFYKN